MLKPIVDYNNELEVTYEYLQKKTKEEGLLGNISFRQFDTKMKEKFMKTIIHPLELTVTITPKDLGFNMLDIEDYSEESVVEELIYNAIKLGVLHEGFCLNPKHSENKDKLEKMLYVIDFLCYKKINNHYFRFLEDEVNTLIGMKKKKN